MLVPAPESTPWVALAESGVRFKHSLSAVGFEHDLSVLDGVSLGEVDLEVDMVFGEAEFAEREPEAFQVVERLGAGVDVALFAEAMVAVLGHKHQGYPVVAGVTRNLFRATAQYTLLQSKFLLSRLYRGQAFACPRASTNEYRVF